MSNPDTTRIFNYPEVTTPAADAKILLDSQTVGSKCIDANLFRCDLIDKTITQRGVFEASEDNADGYKQVTVDIPYTDVHVASGAIATFEGEDLPLKSLTASIEPVQAGSGDPSPSNVRPISGWSGVNVYDDPVYGGTIEWNQLMPISSRATSTVSDVLITNNGDGSFTLNGTASGNIYADIYSNFQNALTANHIYMFVVNSTADTVRITNSYGGLNIVTSDKKIVKYTSGNVYVALYVNNGIVVDNVSAYPQCLDLTMIFGETKAEEILAMESAESGSGVAYVSNLFPKTYYAYNTGTKTCVSEVNNGTYRHYTIPFTDSQGQSVEVFGGSVDVINGTIGNIKTHDCVDMGDLNWTYQALSGGRNGFSASISDLKEATSRSDLLPAIASCYKAVGYNDSWVHGVMSYFYPTGKTIIVINNDYTDATAFKTAMVGQKIRYELATPTTFYTQPTSINSLDGENNVFADTGDGDVEYQTVWVRPDSE